MKLIALASAATILFLAAMPQSNRFAKYQTVEAYEIRPGILVMPRYSATGELCEIGIEKRHYSPEMIRLDSISSDEVEAIFDELVPSGQRGARSKDGGGDDVTINGVSITTTRTYENVSLQIFARELSHSQLNQITMQNIAATIRWKTRKCQ